MARHHRSSLPWRRRDRSDEGEVGANDPIAGGPRFRRARRRQAKPKQNSCSDRGVGGRRLRHIERCGEASEASMPAVRLAWRRAAVTSIAARERLKLSRQSMRQPLVPQRADASPGNDPVDDDSARHDFRCSIDAHAAAGRDGRTRRPRWVLLDDLGFGASRGDRGVVRS